MSYRWSNLTPVNGFDGGDLDNAKQNNYAWSMGELGDYIYVGTGRNIVYQLLEQGEIFGVQPPPILTPEHPNNDAEIWRYHKSGYRGRERVYKAEAGKELMGFRFMITYTDINKVTAIYVGGFTITGVSYMLMSTDGEYWEEIIPGIPDGFSTRTMLVYEGRLYMGVTNTLEQTETTYLYWSDTPKAGWQSVEFGTGANNPKGEVISMASFKGHLYIGTAPFGGFEVWRTEDRLPEKDHWKCVVDKGAGDELNELPLSMEVFKGNLYVGTGIWIGFKSVDPSKVVVLPKGFDIIKVNGKDEWTVVVGQEPLWTTNPTTGKRNISCYPSGFGNIFNNYCWQLRAYCNTLYIGTWDSSILWATLLQTSYEPPIKEAQTLMPSADVLNNIINSIGEGILKCPEFKKLNFKRWIQMLICSIKDLPETYGFDLYTTYNGENFVCQSVEGFDESYNYGIRNLLVADCDLYLGTANPFLGCEVWRYRGR